MSEKGKCIARNDKTPDPETAARKISWCGRLLYGHDWHFGDAEHAAISGAQGSAISRCGKCVTNIHHALRGKLE